MNRTGMATSPIDSQRMLENSDASPTRIGDEDDMAEACRPYILDETGLGSMPPPASLKGAAKMGLKALSGEKANVLLDKLGERLAFERTGSRLYEHFIHKCIAFNSENPSIIDAREIYREELRHLDLVRRAVETLGGDPTAITPSADVQGVASMGLLQVVGDPRTTIDQCLQALLTAELVDNAGWELLIPLAEDLGQKEMADEFREALMNENKHLARVRQWVAERTLAEAHMKEPAA